MSERKNIETRSKTKRVREVRVNGPVEEATAGARVVAGRSLAVAATLRKWLMEVLLLELRLMSA